MMKDSMMTLSFRQTSASVFGVMLTLMSISCAARRPAQISMSSSEGSIVSTGATQKQRTPAETAASGRGCPVASDKKYGRSSDHPIKVGGDFLEGPRREREYLGVLRGPAGEVISFKRIGSTSHADSPLDMYEVTYAGLEKPVVLYLDEYKWSPPMVPMGFTCSGPIPLKAP